MRLDIRYLTRFTYSRPVRQSQNEVRACPTQDDRQSLLSYRLTTSPVTHTYSFTDYWGTRVTTFGVLDPHTALEILVETSVATQRAPLLSSSPRRRMLDDPGFKEKHFEYLGRSPHIDWGTAIAEEAARRFDMGGDDVISSVLAIHRTIGTSFTYAPGATYVGVPVDEVFQRREGVCQDFAHLVIGMCRSVGVPARYVSGYLFASDHGDDGTPAADEVEVQTHAWVEVALPGVGWWALDPTGQQEVTERHVKIGHGRDYSDVPPLRGVFAGTAAHELAVTVQMRREDGRPLPVPASVSARSFPPSSEQGAQQ